MFNQVQMSKEVVVNTTEFIYTIVGKEDCERCKIVKQFLDEDVEPYIYVDFKDLPPATKRVIAKATRKIGEDKLTLPYFLTGNSLGIIDRDFSNVDELRKLMSS